MEMTFRNAAFGGFNRQDVMDYITATAKESGQRIADLEQERDALQSAAAERDALQAEAEGLRERNRALEESLEEVSRERDQYKAQAEADAAQEPRVRELESQAEEYQALKQHIAQIELDAHKRADQITAQAERTAEETISAAKGEADRIRSQLETELRELSGRYEEAMRALEVASGHVTGELRKMDVAVGQLPLAFNRLSNTLRELRSDGPRKAEKK